MSAIVLACYRAVRSLSRPELFVHLVWPGVVAMLGWALVFWFGWETWRDGLAHLATRLPWVGGALDAAPEAFTLAAALVAILLWVPLSFVTASILVATLALPLMLERVARSDYADLAQRRGGSQWGSVANALYALALFLLLVLLSLPLWFIPGVGWILSILLAAWLNVRCYRYDALMLHADREELRELPRRHRSPLLALGLGAGLLAYVPLLNLLTPALCGLAFVHYLLEALRQARQQPLKDVN